MTDRHADNEAPIYLDEDGRTVVVNAPIEAVLALTTLGPTTAACADCERCTWNPGPDCGLAEHPHCPECGHCQGRHTAIPQRLEAEESST